jgi:hypothetical protein
MPCNPSNAGNSQRFENHGSSQNMYLIDIEVALTPQLGARPIGEDDWRTVRCLVSTAPRMPLSEYSLDWRRAEAQSTSFFNAVAAIQLGLSFKNSTLALDTIRQPDGKLYTFCYCEYLLSIKACPIPIHGVPVRFSVDVLQYGPGMTPLRWRPHYGFPQQNILMMRGLLYEAAHLFTGDHLHGYNLP